MGAVFPIEAVAFFVVRMKLGFLIGEETGESDAVRGVFVHLQCVCVD